MPPSMLFGFASVLVAFFVLGFCFTGSKTTARRSVSLGLAVVLLPLLCWVQIAYGINESKREINALIESICVGFALGSWIGCGRAKRVYRGIVSTDHTHLKDFTGAVQSILTVAGIIVTAWWFFNQRSTAPDLKLEHFVSQRESADDSNIALISVEVRATNIGHVQFQFGQHNSLKIYDVNSKGAPQNGKAADEIEMKIGDVKQLSSGLEPGETDQVYFHRFRIDKRSMRTLMVVSHVTAEDGVPVWTYRSLFDLPGVKSTSKESSSK